MPYQYSATANRAGADDRSSPGGAPAGPSPRRPRGSRRLVVLASLAAVLALGGTVSGLLASSWGASGVDRSAAGRAVEGVFLEAVVLEQNLGAPAPAGLSALASDPLVGTGRSRRLARPERSWVGPTGDLALLSPSAAGRLEAVQRRAVDLVFTGAPRRQELGQLAGTVAGEERSDAAGTSPPSLSSPGGASVVRWYSVTVAGGSARVEALVRQWDQQDRVVGAPGHLRVERSLATQEVDALATLVRRGGTWKVATLSQAPWQEPT